MDEFKKNRLLITVCGALIIITIVLSILSNREPPEEPWEFEPTENEFLRNYGINEAIPITINEEQMARIYLAEIVQLIINDPEAVYLLLDEEYRRVRFPNYEAFLERIEFMKCERFFRASLEKFEVRNEGNYRIYDIVDVAGNNFIFITTSILNYRLRLDSDRITPR